MIAADGSKIDKAVARPNCTEVSVLSETSARNLKCISVFALWQRQDASDAI